MQSISFNFRFEDPRLIHYVELLDYRFRIWVRWISAAVETQSPAQCQRGRFGARIQNQFEWCWRSKVKGSHLFPDIPTPSGGGENDGPRSDETSYAISGDNFQGAYALGGRNNPTSEAKGRSVFALLVKVRNTLIRGICCALAPFQVRLPPHTLRAITAGRMAPLGPTVSSFQTRTVQKCEEVSALLAQMFRQPLIAGGIVGLIQQPVHRRFQPSSRHRQAHAVSLPGVRSSRLTTMPVAAEF